AARAVALRVYFAWDEGTERGRFRERRETTCREDDMKVGTALNMLSKEGHSDAAVLAEHMALGDLAEPLGFDSLFAPEHHFTGYAMSPSPTQLLSYYAGRTRRITLGTAVIVLPWHDPVRVAEEIALLDVLSGGRCLFGFGRGAASAEYAGFRVPMEEARARFVEAARIVVKALTEPSFDWDGEFFHIPRTSIRPRPISHPERRFYASSVSPESAEIMAKLGFGVLVVMQNEWPKATEFYVKIQVVGTPDDCLQQLAELHRLTGLDHLVTEFGYGCMPHEEAELNMRLFAERVMPALQRDRAFSSSPAGRGGGATGS